MPAGPIDHSSSSTPPSAESILFAGIRASYSALCRSAADRLHDAPTGHLLLAPPISQCGDAWLIAGSIAGAASLTADADTNAARAALRNGSLDFSVTRLDEALRILKNEIRKEQPVSVCVERPASEVLDEMVERGAQPDFIGNSVGFDDPALDTFLQRGAVLLRDEGVCGNVINYGLEAAAKGELIGGGVSWSIPQPEDRASALRALAIVDALAAALLPTDDWQRRQWLQLAPRYLPRPLRTNRVLPMSAEEAATFEAAIREKLNNGELTTPVELKLDYLPARLLAPPPQP